MPVIHYGLRLPSNAYRLSPNAYFLTPGTLIGSPLPLAAR